MSVVSPLPLYVSHVYSYFSYHVLLSFTLSKDFLILNFFHDFFTFLFNLGFYWLHFAISVVTNQNQLPGFQNLNSSKTHKLYHYIAMFLFPLLMGWSLYILHLVMLQTKQHIVIIITVHNFLSFKAAESKCMFMTFDILTCFYNIPDRFKWLCQFCSHPPSLSLLLQLWFPSVL